MKNRKRKRGWGKVLTLTCGLIIILLAVTAPVSLNRKEQDKATEETEMKNNKKTLEQVENIDLGQGLEILDSGVFSGTFVEDGSDENVEEVFALTIANTSDAWLEYAQIIIAAGEETYSFSISALPAGKTARILEQDRKLMPESKEYEVEIKNVAFYKEQPSLHSDMFEISTENQQITVKNISEKDITGDIYVYYKSKLDDVYIGGIAYRAKLSDGLSSGEEQQSYAGHYSKETSELLFVTYVE